MTASLHSEQSETSTAQANNALVRAHVLGVPKLSVELAFPADHHTHTHTIQGLYLKTYRSELRQIWQQNKIKRFHYGTRTTAGSPVYKWRTIIVIENVQKTIENCHTRDNPQHLKCCQLETHSNFWIIEMQTQICASVLEQHIQCNYLFFSTVKTLKVLIVPFRKTSVL